MIFDPTANAARLQQLLMAERYAIAQSRAGPKSSASAGFRIAEKKKRHAIMQGAYRSSRWRTLPAHAR